MSDKAPSEQEDPKLSIIRRLLADLREHLDCVQLLACTETEDGGTQYYFEGSGLWPARRQMAEDFMSEIQNGDDQDVVIIHHTSGDDEGEDDKGY